MGATDSPAHDGEPRPLTLRPGGVNATAATHIPRLLDSAGHKNGPVPFQLGRCQAGRTPPATITSATARAATRHVAVSGTAKGISLLSRLPATGHSVPAPRVAVPPGRESVPGHGLRRWLVFGGARRVVVQHHVHPVPASARLPSCLYLPRGDPPVQGGQGHRQFPARLRLRQQSQGRPPCITLGRRGSVTRHYVPFLTRQTRHHHGGTSPAGGFRWACRAGVGAGSATKCPHSGPRGPDKVGTLKITFARTTAMPPSSTYRPNRPLEREGRPFAKFCIKVESQPRAEAVGRSRGRSG